jgi:hypothetical protein
VLHATPLPSLRLSPLPAALLAALATLAAVLLLPARLGAQAELSIGPYLSYERLVLNQPAAIGLDVTGFGGPIGLRGSASILRNSFSDLGYDQDPYGSGTNRPLQWNADADLLLRLTTSSSSGSPYVYGLLGLGVMQRAEDQASTVSGVNTTANWSYGGGVTLPIGPLALTGEARLRRPYSSSSGFSLDRTPTREYRLGVSLHFGGGRRDYGARSTPRRTPSRTERIIGAVTTAGDAASTASGAGAARARVVPTAERYLGVKYRYGGTSPTSGFDCSGFVQYVFAKHGVRLPRTSRQQAQAGTRLPTRWSALTPGDLAMFAEDGEKISHVAIYAGGNRIIHATSSGGELRYDDLDTPRGRWFEEHIVAARRVTPDARGLMLDLARGFARNVQLDRGDLAPRP